MFIFIHRYSFFLAKGVHAFKINQAIIIWFLVNSLNIITIQVIIKTCITS